MQRLLSNYKIEVSFADGTTGVADLAPRLSQGPLGDVAQSIQLTFNRGQLDDFEVVCARAI
jgi:hypothetical protein